MLRPKKPKMPMSVLMCLARRLEMILPKPAFFLSLLIPHCTPTDGTLEDARLNATWGFFLSEHEEIFFPEFSFYHAFHS